MKPSLNTNYEKVTRVEVVGDGREYSNWSWKNVYVRLQDDGRTLKVFMDPPKRDNNNVHPLKKEDSVTIVDLWENVPYNGGLKEATEKAIKTKKVLSAFEWAEKELQRLIDICKNSDSRNINNLGLAYEDSLFFLREAFGKIKENDEVQS